MPAQRRSYHSNFKMAVKLGLVDQEVLRGLPRSTLYRFSVSDYSHLVGAERQDFDEGLELARLVLSSRKAAALISAYARIASFFRSAKLSLSGLAKIKNYDLRSKLVSRIKNAARFVPLGQILSALKLPYSRFRAWDRKKLPCRSSPLGRCRSAHPSQLTVSELRSIRTAFRDHSTIHWPLSSIASQLVKTGIVSAAQSTVLKYVKLLGLSQAHTCKKKCVKRGSITTTRPNEAWHVDATFLRARDGAKAIVQFVMDSFSRKILAFRILRALSALATVELLKEARAVSGITDADSVFLISDGGPENDNQLVSEYTASSPLKHLIAQVDVSFSNSLIEAANKTLKYRYIFRKTIDSFEGYYSLVPESIDDYNDRPHYCLSGLSPNEAHAGKTFDQAAYRAQLARAHAQRVATNRASCSPCVPLVFEDGISLPGGGA